MKRIITIVSLLITTVFAVAQDSWRITLNKKTLITSSESNELLNVKKIKLTDWKMNGYLEVSYKETNPGNWPHSLQFTDESGNQLLIKDSLTAVKIPTATLRRLFAGKKQLKIYMVINPPNPMMGVPSRMLHLGTLRLP